MNYSTIPSYDVYVAQYPTGGVVCGFCSFGDLLESVFKAESTEEMLGHLKAHERKGDRVPEDIYERLTADDPQNYPTKRA